jgi:hypothetical protein
MKKIVVITIAAIIAATTASATLITGSDLSGLSYRPNGGTAAYDSSGSGTANLSTTDSGLNGGSPAVFIQAPNIGSSDMGTLNGLSASYTLNGTPTGPSGSMPYWLTYLYAPGGGYIGVVSFGGATLDSTSQIHVFYDYTSSPLSSDTHWGSTLADLANISYGSTTFGQLGVYETGVEIGDWNNNGATIPASASFSSFDVNTGTAAVPEPSTVVAGILLLIPFGISGAHKLRKLANA